MCQKTKSTSRIVKIKCAHSYCRSKRAPRGRYCYRHEHENRKQNNPYLYWFGVNRRNANRRAKKAGNGKFWYVTYEHWISFCDENGYLAIKGRYKNDGSLDCKENDLGYVDGNLQVLTTSDNARKGTKKVYWNYLTHEWELTPVLPFVSPVSAEDLPF